VVDAGGLDGLGGVECVGIRDAVDLDDDEFAVLGGGEALEAECAGSVGVAYGGNDGVVRAGEV
jgi:hypothetical protein